MRRSPHIAVVTNITPNHLDHHRDMDEYINAKRNILLWQEKTGVAVLGFENALARGLRRDVRGECRFFSRQNRLDGGAFLRADGMLCLAAGGRVSPVMRRDALLLRGLHNVENVLAAFAAVWGEVPIEAMALAAGRFEGVEHRIEPVRTLGGVQWFNDSIASSPTRVMAGLRAFDQKLIVIAGGYDKNLDYAPMAPDVLARVKLMILTGPAAAKIEAALRAQAAFEESGLALLHADDMAQAVRLAHLHARAGDIVTLSPGAASFDAYPNFEARGRHYKELVNGL
jgi:UDP-N-acetylmuramoylalanine--D-glutamate ligase